MVTAPSKAQVRLDKAKAKRDKWMAWVDRREAKNQAKVERAVVKPRAAFRSEAKARALEEHPEKQRSSITESFDRLRARLDKKFAKAQARYDKDQAISSR